jgi:hypothetical protein
LAGIRIGQLLVEQGVLSDVQVQNLLKVQKESGRPFGDLAERIYGISPKAVEDAWVEQYIRTAGVIDLNDVKVETECLRLLNRRQAWQFRVLPSNREEGELSVATTPQSLVRAVNFATRSFDEPVYFMLAEHEQLREFLMKHYPVPEFLAELADKF